MTLTNDVAELSGVVMLTSADVTLDTDRRDRSYKARTHYNLQLPDGDRTIPIGQFPPDYSVCGQILNMFNTESQPTGCGESADDCGESGNNCGESADGCGESADGC